MLSTSYNYVGFGAAVSADGKRYFAGRLRQAARRTGAWAKFGSVTEAVRRRRARARHRPLDGRRHAPPGPDLRAALLRGPARGAAAATGSVGHDDPTSASTLDPRQHLRGPRPVAGQGRQLGRLAAPSTSGPDPAAASRAGARMAAASGAVAGRPRAARSGRPRRTAHAPRARRRAPRRSPARRADRSRPPTTGRGRAATRLADRTAARCRPTSRSPNRIGST